MRIHTYILGVLAGMMLSACGSDSGKFKLQGRFRNINQAQFFIYSPDGGFEGIDTINVREGRFAYEAELRDAATFVIVFPNYSEQPVFAKPGASVSIKGDASHMKEMTILGTRENEQMTTFRMELNDVMPPDVPKTVAAFIKENPESAVSIYLLKRYLVYAPQASLKQAYDLASMLLEHNPDNGQLIQLKKQLAAAYGGALKTQLPRFEATDVAGKRVSEASLRGRVGVITAWASWNYQSTDMQRRLKSLKQKHGDRLAVVSICIDGNPKECRRQVVERDSLKWPTVCDGLMWQTPLVQKMGFTTLPANIIVDKGGTIVERNLQPQQLEEKVNQLLK